VDFALAGAAGALLLAAPPLAAPPLAPPPLLAVLLPLFASGGR
jgi:hypothetical protein